jgi:hypothetical protein
VIISSEDCDWINQHETIVNIRVTDTDANAYKHHTKRKEKSLTAKWEQPYSVVRGFVNARINRAQSYKLHSKSNHTTSHNSLITTSYYPTSRKQSTHLGHVQCQRIGGFIGFTTGGDVDSAAQKAKWAGLHAEHESDVSRKDQTSLRPYWPIRNT